MDDLKYIEIPHDFVIEVVTSNEKNLPQAIVNEIEKIWQDEVDVLGHHVFNGRLLSMLQLHKQKMVGEFVSYKHYLAQMRNRALEPLLQIKPIGVSAITTTRDTLLFGKRSHNVFLDKGKYELVPSGGIDPQSHIGNHIDIGKQIQIELQEEAGLDPACIKSMKPFALVVEEEDLRYDVCLEVILKKEALKVPLGPNAEYDELFWIESKNLPEFIGKHRQNIIPVTLCLLDHKARK